ncbi:Ferrichrome-iron receptor precursor [compost metagenome]
MTTRKQLFWATTALMSSVLMASAASAQSTGTEAVESRTTQVGDVVVTGQRGPRNIDGAVVAQEIGKSRSTVTQEYLARQQPGQNVLQSLNLQPGVNFTNNDAYGNSGGDVTIRGFDSQRISMNLDGIQLNDTGNYSIYPTQQIEPELLERVSVNQGTTDVDSPTAAATGGTINLVTRRPANEFGVMVQPSVGTDNYRRLFGMIDTGKVGPWDTSAWLAVTSTDYDQFGDNPGDLERRAVNGRVYQPIRGNGDFLSLAFRYQEDRNNTYGRKSVKDFVEKGTVSAGNSSVCSQDDGGPGRQDYGVSTATSNPGCSNYYGYFINPTDSFNLRGQSRFTLTEKLKLTIDPQYSYTLANGGGTALINEYDQRLQGSKFVSAADRTRGVDLNGDGDIADRVRLYAPSNTNTNRVSVNSSLIYDINDSHRVRLSYTHDFAVHRQTGAYSRLNKGGLPTDVFGGYNEDEAILTLDGKVFQKRDRRSVAELNQVSFQYVGDFFNDALTVDFGLRAPFFSRNLKNNCYQQNTFDAFCSAQAPATDLGAGAPVAFERKYDDILPNLNLTWRVAENQQIFGSYSENLSSPRTDDLYDRVPANPQPETSKNYDIGYRYQSGRLIGSVSGYYSDFQNYIVRAITDILDENGNVLETLATSINAGAVDRWGVDGQIGFMATDNLSLYATASYLGSEVKSDLPPAAVGGKPVPTAGKQLFEVPEWQYGARIQYEIAGFTLGLQGKYVDQRWTNLVNTEKTPAYTLVDLDVRYDLGFINDGMYVQVNVSNLFDEEYLGDISTADTGNRTANLGAPRSAVATLRMTF